MKQVEKKQEQYNIEQTEEENKPPIGNSLLSVAATNQASGKKLLINSVIETFKRSLDNAIKRIESYFYFSQARNQEPLYSVSERLPGCKTTTTLLDPQYNQNLSAIKRQISALIANSNNKRPGAGAHELLSTLSSHFQNKGGCEENMTLNREPLQPQYSNRY